MRLPKLVNAGLTRIKSSFEWLSLLPGSQQQALTGCSQVVNKYIDQGIAELVPGVLFIDEVAASPLPRNHAPRHAD